MTDTIVATLPPSPAWALTTTPMEQGREFSAGFGEPVPEGCPRFLVELGQCEYIDDKSEPATVRRGEPRLHIGGDSYSPTEAAHLLQLLQAALDALHQEAALNSRTTTAKKVMSDVLMEPDLQAGLRRIRRELQIELNQRLAEQDRREGRLSGRQEMLAIILRDRFGEAPELERTAERLGEWLDQAAAIHAITSAASYTDLLDLI